jgi:hypothetical protein
VSASRAEAVLLLAPLRIEALAARIGVRGRSGVRVERVGMGRARSAGSCDRLRRSTPASTAIGVVGFAGGLGRDDKAGDVIVGTEVHSAGTEPVVLDADLAESLTAALSSGLLRTRVRSGPLLCTDALVGRSEREALGSTGCLACEMESSSLLPLASSHCFAIARVVVDHPGDELWSLHTLTGGVSALRQLAPAARILAGVLAGSETTTITTPTSATHQARK